MTLRERIAKAMYEHNRRICGAPFDWSKENEGWRAFYLGMADAALVEMEQ